MGSRWVDQGTRLEGIEQRCRSSVIGNNGLAFAEVKGEL